MSHNTEHARQPQTEGPDQQPKTEGPDPAMQRAPRTLHTESGHAPREPGTSTDSPDRKPGQDLVSQGERDKLALRLQQAMTSFVESPRQAVEAADAVFGDAATQFTDTLKERRRVLRARWQDPDTDVQTEELRLALRQYREITEQLLHMSAPAGQ
ncbi:hypothetical protein ACIHFB_24770 [Streptomyces sp. NPDC051963]|uniref:hypothetical protein n=1 Tax=Streptomyces sp. NPDC051963 TaxID=3365678 RepID=UPI0037D4863F